MRLTKLLEGTAYTLTTDTNIDDINIDWIYCDSRKVTADSLFICISGAASDGHNYARQAYDFGCRVFLCERLLTSLPEDAIQILTEDNRIALAVVSANFFGHPSDKLQIIGITGTKGKTTSALLMYQIINNSGTNCAYIGSNGIMYNDVFLPALNTTPESYDLQYHMKKMVDGNVKILVMEVSSQALYLNRVYGIKFDICVFTNLYTDHIGAGEHPSFEHYKACKASLFHNFGCECIVYNADDKHHSEMISNTGAVLRSFGTNGNYDFNGKNISLYRNGDVLGVKFLCEAQNESFDVTLHFPGEFSVHNALCAIAVCRFLGIPYSEILHSLENASIKGRFEIVRALPYCTFIIDYAHNGESLRAILTSLRQYNPARLICLFGSVGGRTRLRRSELGKVASELADYAIITSDNPDFEVPENIIDEISLQFNENSCPFIKITDREEAVKYAVRQAKDGDIILLAGKGHEDYQLICGVKEPFSEKEIICSEAAKIIENSDKITVN